MTTNPKTFSWTPASANTDPSLPFTAGEVTGFEIGIRPASGTAGAYPIIIPIADPAATSEALSAAYAAGLATLKDGDYQSAIRSTGPAPSAFTSETDASAFTIATPVPVPVPPSGFTVA
jgi:hypothetical protein